MPLRVDYAAAAPRLPDDAFLTWAADQIVFLSSVMGELADERKAVFDALSSVGLRVRWFEGLGGRDDGAQLAYISEVRGATIYAGVLADQYGGLLSEGDRYAGFSATHAEYLAAREYGKRITFWARDPSDQRDGHARKLLDEVRVFQVTGTWRTNDDLIRGLLDRLRELAVDDLAPWVKLGDLVLRATRIEATGPEVTITARVYDRGVLRALKELAGHDQQWAGRNQEVPVTYFDESGKGRVEELSIGATSSAFADVKLRIRFERAHADSMRMGMQGRSADDCAELALRADLLGEAMPDDLVRYGMVQTGGDPWAELAAEPLSEDSAHSLARLLLVERLVSSGAASAIETFRLGPARSGQRAVELSYWEPQQYANAEPKPRTIEGKRAW